MAKGAPMDRRLLQHKIKWTPKRLSTDDLDSVVIDNVFLEWKAYWNPQNPQQSVGGNWRLFYDVVRSGKDNEGKIPEFAVGDVIDFLTAPIYPKTTTIGNVTPFYIGGVIHHYEITLN